MNWKFEDKIVGRICTIENRKCLYHSVLKCHDGMVRLYANHWTQLHKVLMHESEDNGESFDMIPQNIVIRDSGASHNFYPLYGIDGKLYAIGGIDGWKYDAKYHVQTYDEFKQIHFEKTGKKYDGNEKGFHKFLHHMDRKEILNHVKGLYLFQSLDGKKFRLVQEQPIITTKHSGFNSALAWGKSSEFDGHMSCVYNTEIKKYVLYLRDNVKQGIRFIQYSTSEDLLNWSGFERMKLKQFNIEKDNYYSPFIFKHPIKQGIYLGFIPYFKNGTDICCIRIIRSFDGFIWDIVRDIMQDKSAPLEGKLKNTIHFVNGIVLSKDRRFVIMYTHNNYLGLDVHRNVEIHKFKLTVEEFDEVTGCS